MTATPDFMAALYAAVTAVEEGKVAEAVVEHRCTNDDQEVTFSVEIRREVRMFVHD